MNSVDLIVLVVLLLNAVIGAIRGFTWQVFRLGSLVLAFWLGNHFADDFGEHILKRFIDQDGTVLATLSWVVILAGTYLIMTGLGYMMKSIINDLKLTSSDRTLGFLLGGLKGAFFVAIAFQILFAFSSLIPNAWEAQIHGDPERGIEPSQAASLHKKYLQQRLSGLVPKSVHDAAREGLDHVSGK